MGEQEEQTKIKQGRKKKKIKQGGEKKPRESKEKETGNLLLREDLKTSLEENPSAETYSKAIWFYIRRNEWKAALSLYDSIPTSIVKDRYCYNHAICALINIGDLEKAFTLLDETKLASSSTKPNEFTYQLIFDGLAQAQKWQEIISLFDDNDWPFISSNEKKD